MNTKEVTDLLNRSRLSEGKWNEFCDTFDRDNIDENVIDDIIEFLQRGEKYKAIVEKLEKECGYFYYGSSDNLCSIIPRLKQKYFLEPVNKTTITIDIEGNAHNLGNVVASINGILNGLQQDYPSVKINKSISKGGSQ